MELEFNIICMSVMGRTEDSILVNWFVEHVDKERPFCVIIHESFVCKVEDIPDIHSGRAVFTIHGISDDNNFHSLANTLVKQKLNNVRFEGKFIRNVGVKEGEKLFI